MCFLRSGTETAASEKELQRKLHGTRIGLNVRDASELAAILMHGIRCAVGQWRQAEVRIRKAEILMVQSVKQFPSELEILLFRNVELFGQRGVDTPESG